MTIKRLRWASLARKSCLLALAIFLTYQGGYALGRNRGKANEPITLDDALSWITAGTKVETQTSSGPYFGGSSQPLGDFTGDPFGSDPFADSDPMEESDPFAGSSGGFSEDPFGVG